MLLDGEGLGGLLDQLFALRTDLLEEKQKTHQMAGEQYNCFQLRGMEKQNRLTSHTYKNYIHTISVSISTITTSACLNETRPFT